MPEISRPKISHKRGNYPTRKTLDGIAMSLMGTVPVIYNGDSPRDLRDLRGTVPVISPVIYFRDFWSSPHHLFPGTVPVILGPVPAISRDFGDSPRHFPYTNDSGQNFTNQPLVSHVPRNLQ